MNLLAFGEVLFDVYPDRACIGGAPLNFAAHAVKHGETAYMLSAVGADALGERAVSEIARFGVDTTYITVHDDKPTGVCRVTLDERAVPTYRLEENTAWDAIATDGVHTDADMLYFGTLSLRGAHNRDALTALTARCRFREVFVDVNLRAPFYDEQVLCLALRHATLLKISDEELPAIVSMLGLPSAQNTEALLRELAVYAPQLRVAILTCGARGACALDLRDGTFAEVPAVPTTVASTVGAGDSFSAAFAVHYGKGEPLYVCLQRATEVAALVVSHLEAIPDYSPV